MASHDGALTVTNPDCLDLKLLHVGPCCAMTSFRRACRWLSNTGHRLDLPQVLSAPDDHLPELVLEEADEAA